MGGRWWLWVVAALVVAGLAGAAVVVASSGQPDRAVHYRVVTDEFPDLSLSTRSIMTFRESLKLERWVGQRGGQAAQRSLPRIDFKTEMIVIISMGARSSTGYRLVPVDAVERANRVQVRVREESPTVADPGQPGLRFPYLVLILPKIDKSVQLRVMEL